MKIGIDGREFVKNRITGISRFLFNFLSYITLQQSDWQFYVFLDENCEVPLQRENLEKILIPQKITFLWDQYLLLNEIEKLNLDLFYSPYYKFPVLTKIPVITTIFDVIYLLAEPYKYYLKNNFYIKNFIKLTSSKVKKIITCSYSSKNELVKLLKIKEDKIAVIYLSVDPRFLPQTQEEIERVRKKYIINSKYILYVGNSKPHKNLKRLIQAYGLLPKQVTDNYTLVLAGAKKDEINSVINVNTKTIQMIEFVADEDLPALYSGASIFVFPSLCEGFGLPPLEAAACGCPVVVSDIPVMHEILEDAALYFDPYNVKQISETILEILYNESLKKELICKGLLQTKKFSSEEMVGKFTAIFEGVTVD